ncbi:MAG: MFS transporter, partial [Fibrobacterota bacterium]
FSLRLTPVITSVFFIIFGLPAVLFLKERRGPSGSAREGGLITGSYARVFRTLKEIRHYKDLFVFLSAFFFYSAGTSVIISFAAIFAETTFGFGKGDLIFLIIIVNFVAAAGALIFGYVQDLTGCKRSLLITLGIWISAVLTIMFSDSENAFWGASFLVGIAMGSSQSVSRSLVGLFTPPDREAEFYGFWGLSGKLASAFGVFGFGAVSYITGNQKSALFVTAIFFAAGAVILFQVDEKRGRRAAKTGNDLNVSYL